MIYSIHISLHPHAVPLKLPHRASLAQHTPHRCKPFAHLAGFILSGIEEKGLLQAVDVAVEMVRDGHWGLPVPDYVDENVSDKVVKIIQSYVGVVNKMVWRKES